jgi:hypothetical protein
MVGPPRLPKRGEIAAENLSATEVAERLLPGDFGIGTGRDLFSPSILEMLRQLFDDLGFARRGQPHARQPRAYLRRPVRHVRLP